MANTRASRARPPDETFLGDETFFWRSVLGSSLDFRQEAKQTDRTVRVHPSRPSLLLASPSAAPALKTRNKQPSHDMRTCSACKVICVGQGLKVLPGVAGGGAPASRFRQLSSGLWRRQGPIRGPPPLVRSSPSFLIVNGGTHAERGESGARAGRTPLWGKRSGMVFRMHILPEPYFCQDPQVDPHGLQRAECACPCAASVCCC